MKFIAKLNRVVTECEASLDAIPQARRFQEGRPTLAEYISYLTQTYQYTRTTKKFLMMASRQMRRLDQNPVLAALLACKAEEEAGHHLWALSDIRAVGGSVRAAIKKPLSPAVAFYISWNRFIVSSDTPAAFLGTAFLLESLSIRRGASTVLNLKAHCSLPGIAKGHTFLYKHSVADNSHVSELVTQLRGLSVREKEQTLFSAQATGRFFVGLFTSRPA